MEQVALLRATLQNPVCVNQTMASCTVVEQVNAEGDAQEAHILPGEKGEGRTVSEVFSMPCSVIAISDFVRVSRSVESNTKQRDAASSAGHKAASSDCVSLEYSPQRKANSVCIGLA